MDGEGVGEDRPLHVGGESRREATRERAVLPKGQPGDGRAVETAARSRGDQDRLRRDVRGREPLLLGKGAVAAIASYSATCCLATSSKLGAAPLSGFGGW